MATERERESSQRETVVLQTNHHPAGDDDASVATAMTMDVFAGELVGCSTVEGRRRPWCFLCFGRRKGRRREGIAPKETTRGSQPWWGAMETPVFLLRPMVTPEGIGAMPDAWTRDGGLTTRLQWRLLPSKDIHAVVEGGCPNLLYKAVNSARKLRAHLRLDEGDNTLSHHPLCPEVPEYLKMASIQFEKSSLMLNFILANFPSYIPFFIPFLPPLGDWNGAGCHNQLQAF